MKKKVAFWVIIGLIITSAVVMSACNPVDFVGEFLTGKYPEEQLVIKSGMDAENYEYRDGLFMVEYSNEFGDSVSVEKGCYGYSDIFKDRFLRHGWKDGILAVETKEEYYVFNFTTYKKYGDIYDYGVGPKEYTKEEFEKAYPDYETFYWHDCPFVRDEDFTFRNIYN